MTETAELAARLGAALGDGYAVERPLGEGGFAVVFLVRDLALKRPLAVKVLSPDMLTSKSVLERFRREAETVAQLSHPNIVPVHFIGQQGELFYLAMPCVDGGSIADRLVNQGKLPIDDAMRAIREVASALAHAHRRGVVHRDIKPANVLIDGESGRYLVTDFGIARHADSTSLTATGMMLGTPAYLSPEQITGEPSDHRADIFALGVMAYEMLAGKVPFEGNTPTASMMRRLAGPPTPIETVRTDVPANLAEVVARCLAADPADRFQNADEIVVSLGGDASRSVGRTPTQSRPVTRRRLSRRAWIVVGAAAVVLTVIAGTALRGSATKNARAITMPLTGPDSGMVRIGAGAFVIGNDGGALLARPRHMARVNAFAIDRTEVTVAAYREYVAATRAVWSSTESDGRLPATRVPWSDAANYCAWKHPRNGRLPTEFEWEAATRGLAGRTFPWGEGWAGARANTKSFARTGPVAVGSFLSGATPEGIQDLTGNVWEWTGSPLTSYPGASALPDSMKNYRVIRGGAFDTIDSIATGWVRGYLRFDMPGAQLPNTGFRCVIPLLAEMNPRQ
jgi:formylglycine-generating enzyme required for sulfatase activity